MTSPEDAGLDSRSKMPWVLFWVTLAICVLPISLNLLGVSFATAVGETSAAIDPVDAMHHALAGSFLHTILEWSAFMAGLFTAALALLHFRLNRSTATAVVGVALFFAGTMDAFHTLAADRLIVAVADNRNLIPFTWAISRLFNALIILVGVGIFLLRRDGKRRAEGLGFGFVMSISLVFGLAAYGIIHLSATTARLPETMFPGSLITRPWDVAPLLLFILAAVIVLPRFHRTQGTVFSFALLVSMLPQITAQVHMAFGSTVLFDDHFNIAHFLKIIAYAVPFMGLLFEYAQTHRGESEARSEIHVKGLLARQLFLSNAAGAFRVTLEGELLECNDALASMLGYDSPEALRRVPAGAVHLAPESREPWITQLRETGVAMNHEIQLLRRDGTAVWALENSILVDDPSSGAPVVMGTVVDLSKHKAQQYRLEHLAHHDYLTGLPNRRLMQERARHVLAHADRCDGKAALICCDLRRFKQINDAWGHRVGDEVLSQVAGRLTANSRAEDTVVRLGGDEFAVLLPNVKDEQDALASAHRLAEFLDAPFHVEGQSFQLDASFGVAMYPDDGGDIDELLSCADHAMYNTPHDGRKEIQLYSEVAADGRTEILVREEELRRALAQDELTLFYQPIVHLASGRVAGAEALVRWNHPTRGLLPASDFIQLAEYAGLIAELDQWVLGAVVRDLGSFSVPRELEWVSLNVSASSVAHPEFVSRITSALEAGDVEGSRLVVEITERVAMRDSKAVGSLLHALREAGVRVAIDDFGVGHSALSLLRELPVHCLKVDASFMQDVMRDETSKPLVLGIIGLAHGLGLKVIAEGVETHRQYEWLSAVACDYAQGRWTGHPAPAEDL